MTYFSRLSTSSALALVLGAGSASADLSAEDVWADWQAYMTGLGYTISGDESQSGGTLTVTDMTMDLSMGLDGGEGDFSMSLPEITFAETSDGRVQIVLPEVSVMSFTTQAEGETIKGALEYTHSGLEMFVGGDADALAYTYAADSFGMKLGELTVDGVAIPQDVARADITLSGLTGQTEMTKADELRNYAQTMSAASMGIDVFFTDPEADDTTAKIVSKLEGLSFKGNGALPQMDTAPGDINAMLEAGFAFDGGMTFSAGSADMTFQDPEGGGTVNSTSQGGSFTVAMSPDGLVYDVSQREQSVNMLMSQMPIPISFQMAESGGNLTMPVRKSDDPQGFAFGVRLRDFSMSDMLWGMFDPASQLPRDPATLVIDLSGTAKVLFNFLDPATAGVLETSDALPGELQSLKLNEILLNAVGAKLSGNGDFTFDATDTATFGGFPRPEGAVNLELVGGNGLLDKLINMGFVSQDDAQGARFMMGLFARPGEGPDTLVSKIEFNDQGHILANGQRIQ